MILEAKKTLKNKFPKIEIVSIISDFEKGEILEDIFQLTKSTNTRNYFFLLGNTLGNSNNTEKFLSNLKLSMFSEDSLIIGNQIANLFASSKFIKYYQAKEVYNLGESFSVPVIIKSVSEISGILQMDLIFGKSFQPSFSGLQHLYSYDKYLYHQSISLLW